ncbi:hypothetical protein COW36_20465 [bacterium (Candidatus Blackallbacteria) CG17_big_fil_post_rev_8_21_14_2_50_48_46]|uniref:YkgJ family cysteine cluster protein n=1 Tax=bacterium (Candidatus Blackallbacteria) CG17_big_fil_post_rev_8_21_14_2_50_48_46 TaxID=2014261 RepID=A0A2M7G043_9BACT|nr:MAG: hypothetical protein COW64_22790 [bacterium (Candidatus Blackallbacteria) CG18_big_fil_WC_8_21_14_2_50_49_26]PIW14779.1 MAG: hypothetical protein COW36_20465 [bacterium (Candidatus Blackallbacteria) CG17_big_fil_post_rev_8_21_14_2_50_48_46]PIW50881.1 MAG: hypothetical protein COW20_01280 [bacterium (Candidatus Blackallbacteria) CG13_big_fil_rev_8_21_14_2_50_49_14]
MKASAHFRLFRALAQEIQKRPQQGIQLWWDDLDAYHCLRCGHACDRPWAVHISQAWLETWGEKLSDLLCLPLQEIVQPEKAPTPFRYASLRKQRGSFDCIFLDKNKLCKIHSQWGAEAKPEICQRFPHTASALASEHFQAYGLAGSCTDVAQKLTSKRVLRYQWKDLASQGGPPVLQVFGDQSLNLGGFIAWIGLQLDTLEQSKNLSEWIQFQIQALTALLQGPQVSDLIAVEGIFENLQPLEDQTALKPHEIQHFLKGLVLFLLQPRPELKDFLHWLMQPESMSAWKMNASEAQELQAFSHAWLQTQLLLHGFLSQGSLNLLQETMFWGVCALLIQLYALYLRSQHGSRLLRTDLEAGLNQIYAFLVQDYSPKGVIRLQTTRKEACLIQLSLLARWQWPNSEPGP